MRDQHDLAVITNDIYTREDAQFLIRRGVLPAERVLGVETGGCPHTAIREDASVNLEAIRDLLRRFPGLDLIFVESGGDTLGPPLLVINKIALAPYVGADLSVMEADAKRMRGARPFVFTNLKDGTGVASIIDWIRASLFFHA